METIIRPKHKWWQMNWKELWLFRDLLYFLAWRDIKVKYKQTFVGVAWAVFQPLITMVIFTFFFGKFVKVPSDGIPYPLFVYTGLIFWTLFSSGLSHVADVFVANERMISKIYFPRIILPIASILPNVVDFLIASVFFFILLVWYGFTPSFFGLLLFPVFLIATMVSALGIGLFIGSFNVKYRDVRYVLPFFMQLLIFLTPVIYPASVVGKYSWVMGINPMAGIIHIARSAILGVGGIDWLLVSISFCAMVIYAIIGFFYFRSVERHFADVI